MSLTKQELLNERGSAYATGTNDQYRINSPPPLRGRAREGGAGRGEFPWPRIMQLGMGRLGLAPRDFWSMTLRELNAALGLTAHAPGMTRGDLNNLLELYPDE